MAVTTTDLSKKIVERLKDAIFYEELDRIEELLQNDKAIINSIDENGYTPLIYAAECGKKNSVRTLLKQEGIKIDFFSTYGTKETALMRACTEGHVEVVAQLLNAKVNIDIHPADSNSPVFLAASNYNFSIVILLIMHGADPNSINKSPVGGRNTLLHYACQKEDLVTIQVLLAKGALINSKNARGLTALYVAERKNQKNAVKYLLNAGADPFIKDNNGKTVIDYAIKKEKSNSIKIFADHLNKPDHAGNTLLHKIILDPEQTIKLFFNTWQNFDDIESSSETDKINLVQIEIIRKLLKYGVNPNATNEKKETALHIAAKGEHAHETSEKLIEEVLCYLLFAPEAIESLDLEKVKIEVFDFEFNLYFQIRKKMKKDYELLSDYTLIDIKEKTPWQNAILSQEVPNVNMFLAAGAKVGEEEYNLAEGMPYSRAVIKLYRIADKHAKEEKINAAILKEFLTALCDKNTEDNDAFLDYCLRGNFFKPDELVRLIRSSQKDGVDLPFVTQKIESKKSKKSKKEEYDPEMVNFFEEVLSGIGVELSRQKEITHMYNGAKVKPSKDSAKDNQKSSKPASSRGR